MFYRTFSLNCITLYLISISAHDSGGQNRSTNFFRRLQSNPRIVGGIPLKPMEFPWMASIQYLDQHFCGGTLVNDKWIVTAAHCVDGRVVPIHPKKVKIVLGEYRLRKKDLWERVFDFEKTIIHKEWNPKFMVNDIALVKLSRSVNFTGRDRHIKPINLPEKYFFLKSGYECVAIGWGLTGSNNKELSELSQKVSLPIVDQNVCRSSYRGDIEVTEGMICAGGKKGKGICSGDSGGSLQCYINGKWIYAGVDSFTVICAIHGYPSVFTRITNYLDWIRETIAIEENRFPIYKRRSTIMRIVGGQTLKPLEFPWMASLQYKKSHFCAATLISDQWLLTAAHCVDRNGPKPLIVILGEHSLKRKEGTERQFNTGKIFVHEKWDTDQISDDIALIKLSKKVDLNGSDSHIKAIDLPEMGLDLKTGLECIATGWGLTSANSKDVSDLPLKVSLPIVDQKVCAKNYKEQIKIRDGNVCAGGKKGKGICNGDSGGSLQCLINSKWVYVGIDSFTAVCALPDYPSVFTRITKYLSWIQNITSHN